jgi:hypothetical protein
VIPTAEISNKFQKTKFLKEKSVEDVVTLGPTAQATLGYIKMCLTAKEFWKFKFFTMQKHNLKEKPS